MNDTTKFNDSSAAPGRQPSTGSSTEQKLVMLLDDIKYELKKMNERLETMEELDE